MAKFIFIFSILLAAFVKMNAQAPVDLVQKTAAQIGLPVQEILNQPISVSETLSKAAFEIGAPVQENLAPVNLTQEQSFQSAPQIEEAANKIIIQIPVDLESGESPILIQSGCGRMQLGPFK